MRDERTCTHVSMLLPAPARLAISSRILKTGWRDNSRIPCNQKIEDELDSCHSMNFELSRSHAPELASRSFDFVL